MKEFGSLALAAVCLMISGGSFAQECQQFFPQEEGTVLTYVNYDKKDKATGRTEMALSDKEQTAEGMSVVLHSRHLDDSGELLFSNEYDVECRSGVFYFDASKFLDPESMSAYQSMEVEVDADELELPLDGRAGTTLENGTVTAVVRSNGMKIVTLTLQISDREITGRETITTPAGEFDCIRYTYRVESEVGFVKVSASGTEWYHPEYGSVRSETFNKRGKLTGYTVLESVS